MTKLAAMSAARAEIVAAYESGASTITLAADWGVNIALMTAFLHGAGASIRPGGPEPDLKRRTYVVMLRRSGLSAQAIAERLGVSRQRVHQILKAAA